MLKKKYGLVIPFFNEEKRIDCDRFIHLFSQWPGRVLMVDDGSSDKTFELLSFIELSSDAKVLKLNKNVGKASAVRLGLLALSEESDLDWLCVFDSDFSVDEKDIFRVMKLANKVQYKGEPFLAEKIQIVSGSRLLSGGLQNPAFERHPIRDRIGRIIRVLIRTLCRGNIRDPQTPIKVYMNNSALNEMLKISFKTRWFFDIEILIRARKYGFDIEWTEFTLEQWRDVPTKNYSGFRSLFVVIDLVLLVLIRFSPVKSI